MKLNIKEFYKQWGFYPIAGGDGTEGQDGGDGGSSAAQQDAGSNGNESDNSSNGQSQDQNGQQVDPKDFYNGKRLDQHPRFQEVNSKYRQYADLGLTPAEIRQLKSQRDAQAANGVQRDEKSAQADKIRKELREIEPGLTELDRMKADAEERRQETYNEAVEKVDGYLKELGIEVTEANNNMLQGILAQALNSNKRLQYRFAQGDIRVVDEVFDSYKKNFYEPMKRQTAATIQKGKQENQKRLPVVPRGGSGSLQVPRPAKNLKEANDMAWERFQQTE